MVAHQRGQVGSVWLITADVGVRVDDRGLVDHRLDALGESPTSDRHGFRLWKSRERVHGRMLAKFCVFIFTLAVVPPSVVERRLK